MFNKISCKLLLLVIHLLLSALLSTTLYAASPEKQLSLIVEQLQKNPNDIALKQRLKTTMLSMKEPTDEMLLSATPISRTRMELIWLEPQKLKKLAKDVKEAGGHLITEYYDSADNDRREHVVTDADIKWAQQVEKIVDFAYDAGQQGRFSESLKLYKQALVLAPGGDLFLMSIGVAYVQLGEKARGVLYLERAAAISPTNGRIRRNLEAARGY